jgi:ribosomal protein S14
MSSIPLEEVPETPVLPQRSSNRNIKYECTVCGREVGKANLKVKRTQFREMGRHGSIVASRTTGWLCVIPQDDGSPSCLDTDPDWNLPPRISAPGLADTRVASG